MDRPMLSGGDIDARRVAVAVALSLGVHAAVLSNLAPRAVPPEGKKLTTLTVDAFLKAVQAAIPQPVAPPSRASRAAAPDAATAAAPPRRMTVAKEDAAPNAPALASPATVAPEPVTAATSAMPAPDRTAPAQERLAAAPPPIDLDALASQYGRQVADLLVARKRYPRIAQARGWQGRVELEARFGPGGRLGQVVVTRSSGHEALDTAALELLQGAEFPPLPAHLAQADFRLRLPVDYRLQN